MNRVPDALRKTLAAHRSEAYSSDSVKKYFTEINEFYANDAAQEKYERLIARKLKLSVKAGTTWLDCLEKVDEKECAAAFAGEKQCVDVTVKRYFVDIDAIDSSPFLLLFPRSGLAAFYGAMPRALLALNPALDAQQDKRFGPALSVDTATDLLDLHSILERVPKPSPTAATSAAAPVAVSPTEEETTIEVLPAAKVINSAKEPPADPAERDFKFLMRLKAQKSLTKEFYDTSAGLTLARTRSSSFFQEMAVEASFDAEHLPRSTGDFLANTANFGFSTNLHPKNSFVSLANVGAKYRWSRNRFETGNPAVPFEFASENGLSARALVDGKLGKGFARAGLWLDVGALNNNRGSYGRVATVLAYGKEFVLPRKKQFHLISPAELTETQRPCWSSYPEPKNPNDTIKNEQTFDLEIIGGAGRTWGDVPEYARFYAGTPSGQFLYDELNSKSMTALPGGPIVRSLPRSQGGIGSFSPARGGTSYWHTNVTVSIPVPGWSRPLIPHEWVTSSKSQKTPADKEFEEYFAAHNIPVDSLICRDLKSTIKTLVKVSGVNLLVNQQARDKLTDAQKEALRLRNKENRTLEEQQRLDDAERALTQAKNNLRPLIEDMFDNDIIPITNFIADNANIIAVKPLLAFDVAQLKSPENQSRTTRYGLGGGVQIDVVLARFEFGYIAAAKRFDGDPRGNFFGRLILKRLF